MPGARDTTMRRPTSFLFLAALALLGITAVNAARAADVQSVRVSRASDYTRVVFDLSAPVSHKIITLDHPERVVIDIPDTRLKASLKGLDVAKTPIDDVRSGIRHGRDLRVVFDMSRAVQPRSFLLKGKGKYSDRLVVDLYDGGAGAEKPVTVKAPAADERRDIVVAIDAGHGGKDPGAIGYHHIEEKNITLAIARALYARLKAVRGYKPFLVRNGDYYISLTRRRVIAREHHADLFVSIHADKWYNSRAHGSSVYALSQRGATSASARFLAESENRADQIGGVSLADKDHMLAGVLFDLSMTANLNASLSVGHDVLRSVGRVAHLHRPRVEQAAFVVLKSPDIPSILIETGFVSNPHEARHLVSSRYQAQLATAISHGITRYFYDRPPAGTYVAWARQHHRKSEEYIIAKGDTLSEIAQRYQVSVQSLREHNQIDGSTIRPGERIEIPAS